MRLALFIQIEDPKMWLVVKGAAAAARQHYCDLVVYAGPSEEGHRQLDRNLIETCYGFDRKEHQGLILAFASDKGLRYAQELWVQGFPTMLIARRAGAVPFTANNHQETMRGAVCAMAEKGHLQIAFVGGPPTNLSAAEKLAGYMQGLSQCGIPYDPSLVIPGDYTEGTALENTSAALGTGLQFSALIASNDLGAIGAMQALRKAGLAPGGDVEVLGFDNIPQSHWTSPPLSTFDPHYYQMGHRACMELTACVSKRNYLVSAFVPAAFIPRDSTWESHPEDALGHPLSSDWNENRFSYESQFALLKADPGVAELAAQLPGLLSSPESFLQSFRELLSEAARHGLSAGSLFPLLLQTRKGAGEELPAASLAALRQACTLQTVAMMDEQRRATDNALRYGIGTFELRQLSLSETKEALVIACFGRTLRALGIVRAGLHVLDQPVKLGSGKPGAGSWHAWNCGDAEPDTPRLSVPFALPPAGSGWDTIIHLPLIENEELIGRVLLDANSDYVTHYGDLVRQLSTALGAARMRRDLARAGAELVETSRLAGLAEMATGVLHNIGNALNGVNTNCSLMAERLRKSHSPAVGRLAELLRRHETDLGRFLSEDAKGRQVVPFVTQLGEQLEAERKELDADLAELRAMVDHINEIVAAQQSYAQISGVVEDVQPSELLEFALRLGEASLTRHQVRVERRYAEVSDVRIQRQKVVQVLVNLIRNAKESMDIARCDPKTLTLAVRPGAPGRVLIEVSDRGTGIAPENLSRIFSFGFSTKPGGHGFGLHNSALAAKEMGGSLVARSEGPGLGATFVLDLPASQKA